MERRPVASARGRAVSSNSSRSCFNFVLLRSAAADKRERMLQNSKNSLIAIVVALVSGYSANLVAEESKQVVTVVVLCEDAAAQKMIRESLLMHFRSLSDLEVVDKHGYSSLI